MRRWWIIGLVAAGAAVALVLAIAFLRPPSGDFTGRWSGVWSSGPNDFGIAREGDAYQMYIGDETGKVVIARLKRQGDKLVVSDTGELGPGGYVFTLEDDSHLAVDLSDAHTGGGSQRYVFERSTTGP